MKRDFTHENFERFLKQSADNLRMKAPEKVWQNLSKELNKRRRRFVFFLSAFLLVTSAAGYYTITTISGSTGAQPAQIIQPQSVNSNADRAENQGTLPAKKVVADQQPKPVTISSRTTAANKSVKTVSQSESTMLPSITPVQTVDHTADNMDETLVQNDFTPTIIDSYSEFDQPETDVKKEIKAASYTNNASSPLTIESVVNSFKAKSKKQKFEKQFYFAPTVSYRKLTENKSFLRTLDPNAVPGNYPALNSSVSNNVTHKPDVGFEAGFTTKYALSKKLKIRSGFQFNVNRYDVKAFTSPLAIATIALNNGVRVDSLSTISGYSNVFVSGSKSNWLQNFSFQVSAPIGVEMLVKDNEKMQFGFATTVQPTYVLGDRAFLITTDYKNYTEVPWLIRRWNVNTALETFVILKSGKTKWQVGPQVRYQLLSSFISEYPVKENLFDFGLKVGITLNQ